MSSSVAGIVSRFTTYVIDPILLVLAAAGFFFFVWGLLEFLFALQSGGDTKKGKSHMLWGTIGMFIMFSVAGIIGLINNTFQFGVSPNQAYNPNTNVNVSGGQFFQPQ